MPAPLLAGHPLFLARSSLTKQETSPPPVRKAGKQAGGRRRAGGLAGSGWVWLAGWLGLAGWLAGWLTGWLPGLPGRRSGGWLGARLAR